MYVCMVSTFQQSMDQPGMVANPVRGQLKMENKLFPVPVRARKIVLARQIRLSRPASAWLFSTLKAEPGAYVRDYNILYDTANFLPSCLLYKSKLKQTAL